MFGDLFDNTEAEGISPSMKSSGTQHGGTAMPSPPAPRPSCGLAGIDNRGATCYMNALLQTLLLTPEFRESLFALGPSELGELAQKDLPEARVRVIPIQLQRLFGRLLLLDQQSASTKELTDSFGWQNNEQFQQHDVQELNRILFSAIEDSLVGTSGQELISRLYHGIIVNKISCEECGRVSEREEDFLDLTLAVTHYAGVVDTLKTCYVDVELMEGQNKYRCSRCDKLVDAIKSAKIRALPPILTVSLLRFSFDYQKCQRFKETGKYTFPQEIDMSAYCEKNEPSETAVYELFSVLIHSGSTHGGHYHAYIKDIDGLGKWTTPENEVIILPSKASNEGKVDLIELNSPQELLAAMLRKRGGVDHRMAIDKLCQALSEETGVSWNKRFKKKIGSVTKFVKSHQELFIFHPQTNSVSLKQSLQDLPVAMAIYETGPANDGNLSNSYPYTAECSDVSKTPSDSSNQQVPDSQHAENIAGKATGDGDKHPNKTGSRENDNASGGTVDGFGDNKTSFAPYNHLIGTVEEGPEYFEKSLRNDDATYHEEIGQGDTSDPNHKSLETSDTVCQTNVDKSSTNPQTSPSSCQGKPHSTSVGDSVTGKTREDPPPERPNSSCLCQNSGDKVRPNGLDEGKDRSCWFDFNDCRVKSIDESFDLPRQFSGRESAYMLFYRRKSMTRTKNTGVDAHSGMPEWLLDEVKEANSQLNQQREEYDRVVNSIQLSVLHSDQYEYRACALHRQPNQDISPAKLTIDRRRSVADLKADIIKELGESILNGATPTGLCLHTAKELPAGLHLYNCLSENNSAILKDVGLEDNTTVLVWDGNKIDGMEIRTGEACEPVLINLTHAVTRDNRETADSLRGFAKDMTIGEVRAMISVQTEIPLILLTISRVLSGAVLIREEEDRKTVEEIGMQDGDRIIAEYKRKGKASSLAANEAMRQSRIVHVTIENRCIVVPEGSDWPLLQVEIDRDVSVADLKSCIISQLKDTNNQTTPMTECRLRVSAYSAGLQPPLHESLKMLEAGIKSGSELIIEPGEPPKDTQITLSFSACVGGTLQHPCELVMDKKSTVQEALEMMVGLAGVTGDQWHLRKTNWCGEATEFLQDSSLSLDQENILNGALLLLEEGHLPPKGFVRLPIWIYPSPDKDQGSPPSAQQDVLSWINTHIMNLILSNQSQEGNSDNMGETSQHALLGNVELSQDAMLSDLKVQIQTLPAMSEVALPGPEFLRIRLEERGHLGRVLRDSSQTLRRLKVTSSSHIAVQILQEEENLSSSAIVLNICQRIPQTRTYVGKEELIWNTTKSASPESLRQVIADRCVLPVGQIAIAKHLNQKFEWLVIQESSVEKKTGKGRGKRKGGRGGPKPMNLKQAPYNLKDGDTIGVKDLRFDTLNADDFTTEEDDAGKKALEEEAEDKRKRRQELKENNAASGVGGQQRRPKKAEVGLTIRVADFR